MSLKVERPRLYVAALLVILCVVLAMPVMADHLTDASVHTTDSDFNNAATLDNLSVEGSGTGASVNITDSIHTDDVCTTSDCGGFSSSATVSTDRGVIVETGDSAVSGITIHVDQGPSPATTAYIQESDGTEIESTSIDNGQASFSSTLSASTTYYLVVDAGGSDFTGMHESADNAPVSGDGLTLTDGVVDGTTSSSWWMITQVEYEHEDTSDSAQYVGPVHDAEDIEEVFVDVDFTGGSDVSVTWEAKNSGDSSWNTVATGTYSTDGEHTEAVTGSYDQWRLTADFTGGVDTEAALLSEGVRFTGTAPELDNTSASPSGGVDVTESPVNLTIDLADADFATTQGDSVELEWYHNGTLVGTTTHTQNETAWIESDEGVAGTNGWHVEATDDQGHTTTSDTFIFESPENLEIRDVHTGNLIDSAEVSVQFYHDQDNEIVVEESTNDGTVNLAGIDAGEDILVDVETADYYDRSIIIESIWDQQKIYLLNSSDADVDAVQPRFRLNDPSGTFVEDNSDLLVQRPLNHSGSGSEWVTVAGDEFGAEGYTVWLEQEVRYRLILRNDLGDRRTVGSFRPTATETIELKVEGIQYGFQLADEPIQYDIGYNEDTGEVEFAYLDEDSNTTELRLQIYEQGNESNEIANETWSPGNDIEFAVAANNTTNWVVEFQADRDDGSDEPIEVARVVGETKLGIGPDLDPRWSTIAGMGLLVVVGGLFGRGRPEVGAIAVSLLGGILWLIGWMPGATTGAMIVVGIFTSVLFYVHSGGGFR